LLYCCHTVVTLLSHCCYTVVTLLLHCCYTVVTLLLHGCQESSKGTIAYVSQLKAVSDAIEGNITVTPL
jgi:hypothetical protein